MKGFISYSHEDFAAVKTLRTHLTAAEHAYGIAFWSDHRIPAGFHWSKEIANAIAVADVIVLAISPDFIGSGYIWDHELPAIQARRTTGALIVPVVLKKCSWSMICGVLQAVPTVDGRVKAIRDWKPTDDGFDRARVQIDRAIETFFGVTPKVLFGSP